MEKISQLCDKYGTTSMEERERLTLLDNLALSGEKIEEEAEHCGSTKRMRVVTDEQTSLNEFCECLLAILSHELKVIRVKEKPSFWHIAEQLSPIDSVKMIYRLDIRQSDRARCQVWVRHALVEGTMGSYFTLLMEDGKILKNRYRTSSVVRDIQKMEAAKSIINNVESSVHFNIKIENIVYHESAKRRMSACSAEIAFDNQCKKDSPGAITIKESFSSLSNDYINSYFDPMKPTDTLSLPGDTRKCKRIAIHAPSPVSCSLSKCESKSKSKSPPNLHGLATCTSVPKYESFPCISPPSGGGGSYRNDIGAYNDNEKLTDVTNSNSNFLSVDKQSERMSPGLSSDNTSLASSLESDTDKDCGTMMDGTNVIVNSIRIISNDDDGIETGGKLNVIIKEPCVLTSQQSESVGLCQDMETDMESKTNSSGLYCDLASESSISNICMDMNRSECLSSNDSHTNQTEALKSCTKADASSDMTGQKSSGESSDFFNPCVNPVLSNGEGDEEKSMTSYNISHPTITVCGTVIRSETSAFEIVNRSSRDHQGRIYPGHIDTNFNTGSLSVEDSTRDVDEEVDLEFCKHSLDHLSSSSSGSKTEEEYRNQVNTFSQSVSVEGCLQMANVLSNVTSTATDLSTSSIHEDYFIPGIHESKLVMPGNRIDLPVTGSVPSPIAKSSSLNISKQRSLDSSKEFSSPSTPSSFTSKLLEKALKKISVTSGNSPCSDKGVDEEPAVLNESGSDSSGAFGFSFAELGINDDVIGMKEDHFSSPDSFMGFSSIEELENAISSCKQLIKTSPEKSVHRDELVAQLVKLRLKRHELKSDEVTPQEGKIILGHHFYKQGSMSSTLECDGCGTTIFPLLQSVFMCKDCGFHCHKTCLKHLEKPCVHNSKLSAMAYELAICPEVSLSAQQYRCADCFQKIPLLQDGQFEARVCDYTGRKYCTKCHWNDTCIIPARVINNWDFSFYKVSRQSKHLLAVLSKKPDIKLEAINSSLFSFVDELRDVRTLRQQIIMMKTYLVTCRIATKERLLLKLQQRQHFVDSSDIYSLQDLLDIQSTALLDELTRIHASFGEHIKFKCLLCQGKGFFCEYCDQNYSQKDRRTEIIFPFDNHVVSCVCKGIFHRLCYSPASCPKCARLARKKSSSVSS